MFTKLDKLFADDNDENFEKKINEKLEFDSFLEMNSDLGEMWNQSKTIEDITSILYSIDTDQMIDLSRTVFYSILKKLLDLIDKFTSKKDEEEKKCQFSMNGGLSDIYFYEEVN